MSQLDNLFIDIGHSFVKWRMPKSKINIIKISDFDCGLLPKIDNIWLSCVSSCSIAEKINNHFKNVVNIKTLKKFKDIHIGYKNSSLMGVDRFLAILAANQHYPQKDLLIIDIGSAVTMDILHKDNKHYGGLIMPGIKLLRESFVKFTINDSLINAIDFANDTKSCWLAGTANMFISAIDYQIKKFLKNYKDGKVILSGSFAKDIATYINADFVVYDNLVLDGIEYYANNN